MNKFMLILSVASMVVCALAAPQTSLAELEPESQLALFEKDDVETASVKDQAFADFCIQSRDASRAFFQEGVNSVALKAFNVMFNTIDGITQEMAAAKDEQVEQGKKMIQASDVDIEDVKDQTVEELKDTIDQVSSKSVFRTFGNAIYNVFAAVIDALLGEARTRFNLLKAQMTGTNMQEQFETSCQAITSELKPRLVEQFVQYRASLLDAAQGADKARLASYQMEDIGCVTARRVSVATKVCGIAQSFGPVVYPIIFR